MPRFEESLACYAEVGEVYGRGFGLNMLADAYQGLGRSDEAIESYRLALAQFRDLGHRLGESIALRGLGTVLLDSDPTTAREHLRHALAILDDLAHPDAEALRAKLSILD